MVELKGVPSKIRADKVWYNGELLSHKQSLKIRNHSPSGFAWGYMGSGPTQLSLAILMKYCEEAGYEKFVDLALASYHDFKHYFIAKLPAQFHVKVDIARYLKKGDPQWENI